jgi:hypothetical protein
MKNGLIAAVLTLIALATAGRAGPLTAAILQATDNRLYFSAGRESGLRPGCRFVVNCEGEEVVEGKLDFVGPNISWSEPHELPTLNWAQLCSVQLHPAEIDSSATIVVGTALPLSLFDPVHETLFLRSGDTVLPNLAVSAEQFGNMVEIRLRENIVFSDSTVLDATALIAWLENLRKSGRSPLVRFFFANLMPLDSGGAVVCANHCVKLYFRYAFPKAPVYLSHPEFGVYNKRRKGTGPYVLARDVTVRPDQRSYVPNGAFRGNAPPVDTLIVRTFAERYQMHFSFDDGQLSAYIGFGTAQSMRERFQAQSLYPFMAALIPNTSRPLGANTQFVTSLYYGFDTDNTQRFFDHGDAVPVNIWFESEEGSQKARRMFPYNPKKGKQLFKILRLPDSALGIAFTDPFLEGATRYLADIAAQEGMTCDINPQPPSASDLSVTLLPASDRVLPGALIGAVLELSDQRGTIMTDGNPFRDIWERLSMGTHLDTPGRRSVFFERAEEELIEKAAFFPLFRPYIFAVGSDAITGLRFDPYGYPQLDSIKLYKTGRKEP